eukprot:TRINITY_DN3527_c0_g1_i1.p2 TRINITY_DN3527_c0_g1~~TRINITY_DN3527_c0_g1_i1.p2  ORF type:complete len:473 (-),score=124.75 TRINITY_DN3527_c0_g1_i1:1613-3031(-)
MNISRIAFLVVLCCLVSQTLPQNLQGGSTNQCPQGQVCNATNTTNTTNTCPQGKTCNGSNSTMNGTVSGGNTNRTGGNSTTGGNMTGAGNSTCPVGQVCNGGGNTTMGGGNSTTGGSGSNTCPVGKVCTVTCPAGQICAGTTTTVQGSVQTFNSLTGYNQTTDNKTRIDPNECTRNAQSKVTTSSSVGKVNVDFAGQAGLVQIGLASNTSNSTGNSSSSGNSTSQYMAIKFRKLSDSAAQIAQNFDNATWTWAGPTAGNCQGVTCSILTATATLTIQASNGTKVTAGFVVQVQTYNASGFISYGALNSSVDPSCVKFTYNVTNWPFPANSSNSSLYLSLTLASGQQQFNATADKSGIKVGGGLFSTPSFAYLDGSSMPSPVDVLYGVDSEDTNGTQGFVVFKFSQFNGSLYYDPLAYSSSTTAVVSTTVVGTGDNTTTSAPTAAPTKKGAVSSSISFVNGIVALLLLLGLFI